MLVIGKKTFMNLQEAVAWLLENNALPFQSTANYAGNTEIPNSTLINPSPAKVRVGSLIFFADSKVSTVIGVTSNSFIVSTEYNDLVDDVVYVSNVALNASGHLIVTLSNGDTIDAGLVKQVSGFSINSSQHLIVSYNDGTSSDLGAIFSGNINISGNLFVTGSINGENNPSLKPIYYHPVYMFGTDTSGNLIRILVTILDNSPTQYNDGTVIAKLVSLLNSGAIINVDGIVIDTNNNNANAYMIKNNGSINELFWNKETTRGEIDLSTITWSEVIDGVNKIN